MVASQRQLALWKNDGERSLSPDSARHVTKRDNKALPEMLLFFY